MRSMFMLGARVNREGPVAAWPGGPGEAPTHLPLYDVGRHGHRRAPGGRRSLNFTVNVLSRASAQSTDLMVINLDSINKLTRLYCACASVGFAGADTGFMQCYRL